MTVSKKRTSVTVSDRAIDLFGDRSVTHALRVPADGRPVILDAFDPDVTPVVAKRKRATKMLIETIQPGLADLQDRLMAEKARSILVVLQGIDGSGKSGTVKHVAASMNAVGVGFAGFKEPDPTEKREPFLERIRRELPGPGTITFFDRSYFEDAVVPIATGDLKASIVDERIEQINRFEADLNSDGIVLIKCFLHLSYDEQRQRFLRRLDRPDKYWKFAESDIDTRELWQEYQFAYATVMGRTASESAPWFVVPANRKWYRNWAVASLLLEHLTSMDPKYPALKVDADAMRLRLTAPN